MTTEINEFEWVHDDILRASTSEGADLAAYLSTAMARGRKYTRSAHVLDPAYHAAIHEMLPGVAARMKGIGEGYLPAPLFDECFDAVAGLVNLWVEPQRVRLTAISQRISKGLAFAQILENAARNVELVDLINGPFSHPLDRKKQSR